MIRNTEPVTRNHFRSVIAPELHSGAEIRRGSAQAIMKA
jgi:hypothetical protein